MSSSLSHILPLFTLAFLQLNKDLRLNQQTGTKICSRDFCWLSTGKKRSFRLQNTNKYCFGWKKHRIAGAQLKIFYCFITIKKQTSYNLRTFYRYLNVTDFISVFVLLFNSFDAPFIIFISYFARFVRFFFYCRNLF